MTTKSWDSYFDEIEPDKWRFFDFYQHRQRQSDFNNSFSRESFVLKKSLDRLLERGSYEAKKHAKRLLNTFKASTFSCWKDCNDYLPMTKGDNCVETTACCLLYDLRDCCGFMEKHRTNYDEVNTFWNTVETIQTKQKELEVKKIEAVQSVFDGAITYTEEVFATATENLVRILKMRKNVHFAEFLKDKTPLPRVVTPRKESLSEYTAGSAKLLDQMNKDIFSDEEEVEEHNNSKQKRRQTRYGRDIPDYSEQESDQEYEKRVRIKRSDSRSHHAGKDDKPEIDNGKFKENYDEETELFFESSNISTVQELVTESITNATEELVVKLLRWQENNLKQLCHGVHRPEEQNINNLLSVSSIFYFRQQNEQSYLGFLTVNEISKIRSGVISKFVKITTPHELISFVDENKKKFQRDSQEEIARFIKLSAVKQNEQNGSLLNETFFRLLEGCATWNPSVDVNKMNEGTFIVDYIGPLFNKTIHYFNYVTIHSWIDTVSDASKLRRVTSPKRRDEEHKGYWDIYRGSIHAKDSIDFDIKHREMQPDETNQIVIFNNGHKMEVCVMTLYYPGIYLLVEVESCTIPKTVRDLGSLIKLHQILMSIRENAIDLLGERSRTTPLQTNYSEWLRPTADTPSAKTENYLSVLMKNMTNNKDYERNLEILLKQLPNNNNNIIPATEYIHIEDKDAWEDLGHDDIKENNEEAEEEEVEPMEEVEIISNKTAEELINAVLMFLYQQPPEFGEVDKF
ncbi:8625_t:CDS:10 [Funneliformis mosseae]|uniref:8625_t:CDS:1 n=1 Tax=Funneliformis mosseae TaxID=27381 RepID=A0A9N8YX27_FUNMO|nr:8625_t:CDS:10 [Funneliformis mosseae]